MKISSNIFALLCMISFSHVYSMFCVARQIGKRGTVQQKQVRYMASKKCDFFDAIQKVGLTHCMQSYFSDAPCSNDLCCKHAFFEVDDLTKKMSARIRADFLRKIDTNHNRLEMAIIIKDKYKQLEKIKKNMKAFDLQEKNPEQYKHLMKLIGYQQSCLRNQFNVIKMHSPTITTMSHFELSNCPEKGLKVKIVKHYPIDEPLVEE